jgi:trimeric autotransporter adhesin
MKPNSLFRCVSLLALASAALTAQVARQGNMVPLKNWTTPLYWQPSQTEREGVPQAVPQNIVAAPIVQPLLFSANAVSTSALIFVAITPCRLVDTRGAGAGFNGVSPFSGPAITAGGTITIPVQSSSQTSTTTPAPCGAIPAIAQAYSFNLTVVPHSAGAIDFVTLWPSGVSRPVVSTLDDPQGAILSNAAIVPAGTPSGGVSVYNAGPGVTDVVIDMNGYFSAPTDVTGNTAIGAGTLQTNTSGSYNTATGFAALGNNTTGYYNTASGVDAMAYNNVGVQNTATGFQALFNNTSGNNNTASGMSALAANTSGSGNTATGFNALLSNTTGGNNTATGLAALQNNLTGASNTASGVAALQANTTGGSNTASGFDALQGNTTGGGNTGNGTQALQSNTTGSNNTANGNQALQDNTTGTGNTASGAAALNATTTGGNNTASGASALGSNTTGNSNIAIGYQAAFNVGGGGSNNIHIGNVGASSDGATNGVIRIGAQGTQTTTFIAGISGATPGSTNLLVCVDGSGQLGTTGCGSTPSSRRFKEQITDMGDSSSKLLQLRPVTFLYKPQYDDGSHTLQYGLIAEEVAQLYPEMVGYDKDGQPSSVKYQVLAPMLLNEMQKQNAQLQSQIQLQQEENRKLEDRLAALEVLLSSLTSTAARPTSSQ